ncbi:hypothetical protein NHQ30_008718 [Ciborinia camelliae]|nr:hypothetical protein NHQ30_008718 [Ciborinia camelliae]
MSYSLALDDTPQGVNLFSEWLCWCMLWAGIEIYSFIYRKKTPNVQGDDAKEESTSLAFFIVTSSVCASIVEVNWILPFLTPALYFVTRNNSVDHYVLPSDFKSKRSEYPANYSYHLIFYILVAISTAQIRSNLPRKCSTRRVMSFFALFPIAALLFRFGISETTEAFWEVVNAFFSETPCAANGDTVRNATEIAQAFMDEPSRLMAEFGPRQGSKSWLDFILRFSNSCKDSTPLAIELR